MRSNQIIERLKEGPCINGNLPYRVSVRDMGLRNRQRVRRISIAGRKSSKRGIGTLLTVYYLAGDEDRAIQLFAEVNAPALAQLDLSHNTLIDSALPHGMAQRLRAIL